MKLNQSAGRLGVSGPFYAPDTPVAPTGPVYYATADVLLFDAPVGGARSSKMVKAGTTVEMQEGGKVYDNATKQGEWHFYKVKVEGQTGYILQEYIGHD